MSTFKTAPPSRVRTLVKHVVIYERIHFHVAETNMLWPFVMLTTCVKNELPIKMQTFIVFLTLAVFGRARLRKCCSD